MGRGLRVTALAGVLAAFPALAPAQSSLTIGGFFKVGLENIKIGNANPARTGNASENRVTDNLSRIVFNITEDVGNGLQAVAQVDNRFSPDNGAGPAATGATWVGLRSRVWGRLTFGRHDLHYGLQPDDIASKAGSDKARSVSLFDFVQNGAATQAIANASRTPNVIRWDTPNWNGFRLTTAYSTNAAAASEADIGSAVRKGAAWNLNPSFAGSNWQVGYSYWNSKPDASLADQRGDTVYAYYKWSGVKVGLGWNKSKLKSAGGIDTANRNAWTLPLSYSFGPHNLYAHYTRADDDKIQGSNTGANMFALAYVYDISKRTSFGLTYARIRNEAAASYQFFTDNGGSQSSGNAAPLPGEDPQLFSTTLKHAF
jgi:predicted porin